MLTLNAVHGAVPLLAFHLSTSVRGGALLASQSLSTIRVD